MRVTAASVGEERVRERGVPGVVACGLVITGLKLGLATAGFARTLRWVERRTAPAMERPGDATIIERVAHAVALAAALYPGRALCLEQSLALYYLLRRRGIDARLRLGVQPHPFSAHAWVEYGGVPLNDFPEHVKHFIALPEVRP
jgi:hypothetical protein